MAAELIVTGTQLTVAESSWRGSTISTTARLMAWLALRFFLNAEEMADNIFILSSEFRGERDEITTDVPDDSGSHATSDPTTSNSLFQSKNPAKHALFAETSLILND
jgi:hypothetical protein